MIIVSEYEPKIVSLFQNILIIDARIKIFTFDFINFIWKFRIRKAQLLAFREIDRWPPDVFSENYEGTSWIFFIGNHNCLKQSKKKNQTLKKLKKTQNSTGNHCLEFWFFCNEKFDPHYRQLGCKSTRRKKGLPWQVGNSSLFNQIT